MPIPKTLAVTAGAFIIFLAAMIPTLSHVVIAFSSVLDDGSYVYQAKSVGSMVRYIPIYVWVVSGGLTLIGLRLVWEGFQPVFEDRFDQHPH